MGKGSAERAWVLPGEPVPVRLMATIWADTEGPHDDFAAPPDVDDWLDAVGIDRGGDTATREEFLRARDLRDSARRLAALVTGDDRPAAASPLDAEAAVKAVNDAAGGLPAPRLSLAGGGLRLATGTAASRVTAGLARVAAETQLLLAGDDVMLRACHAPGCVLYFVKTHPRREWCSVACGNRARAARHYKTVRSARSAR